MRLWVLLAIILYPFFSSNAQSGLCKSSFGFNPASQSSVIINPSGPGAFRQLYNTNGFTWEAWFRLRANPVNGMLIMAVEDNVLYQDIFLGFGFGPNPTALSFQVSDNGATNAVAGVQSVQAFSLNTWYHVAAVCDYANAQFRLYLDGNLLATATIPTAILLNRMNQDRLAFIGNASTSVSTFNGDIDEVRYWSTVRTQAQIQQNAIPCMSLPQTGLVVYFKADETTGTFSKSVVNNNFSGTLQNTAWSAQYPGDACYVMGIADNITDCKTLDVQGSITNGVPISAWKWDFDDGTFASTQNAQHTYSAFGDRTIKLVLTDNNGCKDSIGKLITVPVSYIAKVINMAICQGTSYAGYTSTGIYLDTLPGTGGCDTARKITLTVNPKPSLGKDTTLSICEQTTINLATLYATNSYPSVVWNTPNVTSAPPGTYTLQVTTAQGCGDTAVAVVQVLSKYNTLIDTTVCAGTVVAGYSVAGTYTDQFTSVQGCDSVRTLHLSVLPLPEVYLGKDTTICTGDSVLLDAGDFASYRWQDGSVDRYLMVKKAGRYSVTVTSDCGSAADDIFIRESPCRLLFPSAFSPNGDNRNDVFKALSVRRINNFHLLVYNRWGQKVFETNNTQQGWDGNINGKPAGTGTFVWFCEYSMDNLPQKLTMKGVVTLLR